MMGSAGISLASAESFFLLIMTATWQTYGDSCSGDVTSDTSQCLLQYTTEVDAVRSSGHTFYSGVDVESIRMICRSLRQSALCAHQVKVNCPDTENSDIETLLSEHLSIAEMCEFPNFYELYARTQFCFNELAASSEKCYQSFRADAESETKKIFIGDQSSLRTYCSYLDTFVECIKANVRINCADQAAAGLVETLVRPSVSMSEHCKNETTTTSTEVPTTKKASRRKGEKETYAESKSTVNNAHKMKLCLRTFLLILILTLLR